MTAVLPRVSSRFDRDAPPPPPLLLRFSTASRWLTVIGASVVLGLAMSESAALSTLHLVATLGAVVVISVGSRRPDAIVAITVYAGMCDVVWRSTDARGPYEASKYAIIIGFGLLALRFFKRPRNLGITGAILLLLVPGAVLGGMAFGFTQARMQVSSNLTGLIAVCVAVLACSNLRLSHAEMRGVYVLTLSPVVSLAAHATLGTITTKVLNFSDEVNFESSGGFGPNQVSSALCFGALLCLLVLLQPKIGVHFRALALITAGWLVGQAVLTFSRGGLFALVLAGAGIGLVALSASGHRWRVLVAAGVIFVVAIRLLSWAGAFTGGASEKRLSSTNSTNRTNIAMGDLRLFRDHPLQGVGVGQSQYQRDIPAATHTEFTRLLAEHGFFGVVVLGLLIALFVRLVRTAVGWYRLAAMGLLVMAVSQMTHSATRIGSIAIAWGLAAFLGDSD